MTVDEKDYKMELVAIIEHGESGYARIIRLIDVSTLPHGTKLYAALGEPHDRG